MTKNLKNDNVGDTKAPALRQTAESLNATGEQARKMQADRAPKPVVPSKNESLAKSLENQSKAAPAPGSCVQKLWFSFFFDGTGNNLDADNGTLKHSNVARLYRAHRKNDEDERRYRIYIPGVGTYFKEVGNYRRQLVGGTYGLVGTGDLTNYVGLSFMWRKVFDRHPVIASLLAGVKAKKITFDAAMQSMPESIDQDALVN